MHLVAYKSWKNCHYFESYGILKPPEVLLRKDNKKKYIQEVAIDNLEFPTFFIGVRPNKQT